MDSPLIEISVEALRDGINISGFPKTVPIGFFFDVEDNIGPAFRVTLSMMSALLSDKEPENRG